MIAFSKPELMADGIGGCEAPACQTCDVSPECDPEDCPQDAGVCENCHNSLLHFLTDDRAGFPGGWQGDSRLHLMGCERVLVPEGPYLDRIEPPLI